MKSVVKPKSVRSVVRHLLAWYGQHARDLPWRRTHDPYAIWVSEIMLQQTQVKTVVPYFERWMIALPTIQALAAAKPERIHKLWEGLGYYTRVRNLQKAARIIVEEHGGKFPRDFESVLALPGIGRYTAGAICSIAFHQPKPILDGNVIRVLTRLFAIPGNPKDKAVNAQLWQLAELLVHAAATSAFPQHSALNQSLMELGALICMPRNPDCGACPLCADCSARRQNRIAHLPALPRRAPGIKRRFAAFVLRRGNCYLVRQRPTGVVNAHLWEFPNLELADGTTDPQAAFDRLSDLGLLPARGKKMPRASNAHLSTKPLDSRHARAPLPSEGRGFGGEGSSSASIMERSPLLPKFIGSSLFHSDLLTAHESPERRPVAPLSSEERGWSEVELLFRFMGRCSNEVTLAKLCSIKHTITRYRITLDVFHATLPTPSKNSRRGSRAASRASLEGRWLTRAALRRLAFTSAHKKILGHLAHLKS